MSADSEPAEFFVSAMSTWFVKGFPMIIFVEYVVGTRVENLWSLLEFKEEKGYATDKNSELNEMSYLNKYFRNSNTHSVKH